MPSLLRQLVINIYVVGTSEEVPRRFCKDVNTAQEGLGLGYVWDDNASFARSVDYLDTYDLEPILTVIRNVPTDSVTSYNVITRTDEFTWG